MTLLDDIRFGLELVKMRRARLEAVEAANKESARKRAETILKNSKSKESARKRAKTILKNLEDEKSIY